MPFFFQVLSQTDDQPLCSGTGRLPGGVYYLKVMDKMGNVSSGKVMAF